MKNVSKQMAEVGMIFVKG